MEPAAPVGDIRAITLATLLMVASVMVVLVGLMLGTRPVAPGAVWNALFAPNGSVDSILVWTLRLPRSLAAFAAGTGLAVAGYILQTLTRNPLAGPGLTGVAAGAILPIVLCFVFLPVISSIYYPPIGLIGGLAAALTSFWIARGGSGRPLHLALGGISVSIFLGAITTWVILSTGPQIPSLMFWLSGGLQGRSWPHLAIMLPWVLIGLVGALACHRALGLLALSEQAAAGMGLNLGVWKPLLLILSVIPVAGITPIAGPVAFVGLASPHIARLMNPKTAFGAICLSASVGGLMVVLGDVVARSIAPPREIPVGLVTALIGGPIFIWLVQRWGFASKVSP